MAQDQGPNSLPGHGQPMALKGEAYDRKLRRTTTRRCRRGDRDGDGVLGGGHPRLRRRGSTATITMTSTTTFREDDVVAVIVDAENVRGKTGFELDHADLLDRLLVWASMRGHAGRTIVVVDHGNEPGAHLLRGGGSIIAGPPPTFASRSRDRE